jgi:hypothetical protein
MPIQSRVAAPNTIDLTLKTGVLAMLERWSGLLRRDFLKVCAAATASTTAPFGLMQAATALGAEHAPAVGSAGADAVKNIRPEIGTGWRGHMFPGAAGGEFRFRMASKLNKDWASAREDRPPSGLVRA